MLHRLKEQRNFITAILTVLLVCAAPLCAAPLAALAVEAIPAEEMPAGEETGETEEGAAESAWAEEELAELDDTQRSIVEMYDAVPGQLATVPLTGDVNAFWETEDGLRYRLFEEGADAVNTWVETEDGIYYFGLDGYAVTSLQTINSHTYFFRDDYTCAFGAVLIGEDTFFFTPAIGMNHGWVQDEENDARYFLNEDGTAYTGWMEVNGFPTFYFGADGKLCIGWADIDGQSYIFDSDGKRQSGWVGYNGDLYYLGNHEEAVVQKKEWVSMESDGKRRYVQSDGKMAYDVELDITGLTYTFDADGVPHLHIMSGIRNNMPYLIAFLVTTLLIAFGDRCRGRRAELSAGVLAIGILVFLAAARSFSVGFDLRFYVTNHTRYILENGGGFLGFYRNYSSMEPLYLLMEYICVKIFKSARATMAVIALLTNGFIYAGIRQQYERGRRWLPWLAWCLLFYPATYNIMRQYIVIAILYYVFSLGKKLNWKKVAAFTVLAMLFHYAAGIGIVIYALFRFFSSEKVPRAVRYPLQVIILLVPSLFPMLFSRVLETLDDRDMLFSKYAVFIAGNRDNHSAVVNYTQLWIVAAGLITVAAVLFERYRRGADIRREKEHLYFGLLDLSFSLWNNALNTRFQYFISILRMDAFSDVQTVKIPRRWRIAAYCSVICILFVYWYRYYLYDGLGGVAPYQFWWQE